MSWGENPYDAPEKHGLTIVGEAEWSDECYQFDKSVVWRDEKGQLYYAEDSGCSCPSPFEGIYGVDDLEKVTEHEVIKRLSDRAAYDYTFNKNAHLDIISRIRSAA